MADAFEIVRVAGQFEIPVPLVETMLAGWLLGRAEGYLDCFMLDPPAFVIMPHVFGLTVR